MSFMTTVANGCDPEYTTCGGDSTIEVVAWVVIILVCLTVALLLWAVATNRLGWRHGLRNLDSITTRVVDEMNDAHEYNEQRRNRR